MVKNDPTSNEATSYNTEDAAYESARSFRVSEVALVVGLVYLVAVCLNSGSLLSWVSNLEQDRDHKPLTAIVGAMDSQWQTFAFDQPKAKLRSGFYDFVGLERPFEELGFAAGAGGADLDGATFGEAFDPTEFAVKAKFIVALDLGVQKPRLLALETAPSLADPAAAKAPDSPYVESITPFGEQHILVVGDSIMGGIAPQIKKELRKLGTKTQPVIQWKVSSGLGRPDYYNWPKVVGALVAQNKVDYAVALFGTNDVKALRHGSKFIKYDSAEWHDIYNQRVAEIQDLLCQKAQKVYWLALPPMRKEDLNAGATKLNGIFKKHAASRPCIEFVSLDPLVADQPGIYTKYKTINNERVNLRAKDGIHLSGKGGNLVARYVLDLIGKQQAGPGGKPESPQDTALAH